jgi:FkbM family methyltransferase
VDSGVGTARVLAWNLRIGNAQRILKEFIREGDNVFDVGANVGFYTLVAARLVGDKGHVVAFEPLPRNLRYLTNHVELNRLKCVRVVVAAVSEKKGSGFLAPGGSFSQSALATSGLPVDLVSLDDVVLSGGMPGPTFIKIDVEGSELSVLRGAENALERFGPVIVLAGHGYSRHQECREYLESRGYTVRMTRDGSADGNYELLAERTRKAVGGVGTKA